MVHQLEDCGDVKIELLGSFAALARGRQLRLPLSVQRVLAVLAIQDHDQDRHMLAAMLYPDARRQQVSANLRSAIWRARKEAGEEMVCCTGDRIGLHNCIQVDFHYWAQRARYLMSNSLAEPPEDMNGLLRALSQQILPSWDDEWLHLERQRWDELRLHALEMLSERLSRAGRHVEALEAGLAAVSIEPYRETAHYALISAYLAEGNYASAVVQYTRFQRLLSRDLGLRPTPKMQALVRGITDE